MRSIWHEFGTLFLLWFKGDNNRDVQLRSQDNLAEECKMDNLGMTESSDGTFDRTVQKLLIDDALRLEGATIIRHSIEPAPSSLPKLSLPQGDEQDGSYKAITKVSEPQVVPLTQELTAKDKLGQIMNDQNDAAAKRTAYVPITNLASFKHDLAAFIMETPKQRSINHMWYSRAIMGN